MKIILQAGHEGRTSGSTGAPNEQAFNIDISNRVADEMRKRGVEVRRVNADPKPEEIAGDWDLFLAIHYDADVYGTGGFFTDFPEPSTDGATERSQAIAKTLQEEYGNVTKIVNHPERSNKNTRFYYMWKSISAKTPCVIIECGVGMHTPDDHTILHFNRPLVVEGIVRGLCKALGVPFSTEPLPNPCAELISSYEKILSDNKVKIAEMEATISKNEVAIVNGSNRLTVLENEVQTLSDQVSYYKPYKSRYEEALTKIPNAITSRELFSLAWKKWWEERRKK